MSSSVPIPPTVIDTRQFTRSQLLALEAVLSIQRAVHISPDYRRHLSTLVLRNLPLEDLCTVVKALLSTLHLAAAKPTPPENLPRVIA